MDYVILLSGIISVIYAGNKNYLTWIAGLVNVGLLSIVFYENDQQGLLGLQVFFLIMTVVGLVEWIGIYKFKQEVFLLYLLIIMIPEAIILLGIPQASIIIFGILGTYLLIFKIKESWVCFSISNIISIFDCVAHEEYIICLQYIIFLILSIKYYIQWLQD